MLCIPSVPVWNHTRSSDVGKPLKALIIPQGPCVTEALWNSVCVRQTSWRGDRELFQWLQEEFKCIRSPTQLLRLPVEVTVCKPRELSLLLYKQAHLSLPWSTDLGLTQICGSAVTSWFHRPPKTEEVAGSSLKTFGEVEISVGRIECWVHSIGNHCPTHKAASAMWGKASASPFGRAALSSHWFFLKVHIIKK